MTVRFYFGAISPYSWFAAERIGARLPEAEWRPIFAGGLFRSVDRSSWGLDDDRRAAGITDCENRAAIHGLGPINWPADWPANDILIARAMTAAAADGRLRELALAAMRATFRAGARLTDPDELVTVADGAGLDGAALLAATERPEVKDALRAANDEAVAAGVIGVPTVLVGDALYWGDDRLDEAAAAA